MTITEDATGVTFDVLVQPRASRARIGPVLDGRLKIAVTSPPVDGEANAAVIDALAAQLRIPRSSIAIVGGATNRRKRVRIAGVTRAAIEALK